MNIKQVAGTVLIAGALGASSLGAGVAQARPGPQIPGPPPVPPVPAIGGPVDWNPAPGQIKKFCPWQSPPGQWVGGPHGIPCT